MFYLSLRMTRRDWCAGGLRFLLIALIVTVAALSSVGFLLTACALGWCVMRINCWVQICWLGPIRRCVRSGKTKAAQSDLHMAQTVVFPSMALAGEGDAVRSVSSSINAVSAAYPLRGQLKLSDAASGTDQLAQGAPPAGTVWVDPNILSALQLKSDDMLKLGDKQFRISGIIAVEPDRGSAFVNFAPRVMLSMSDLAATGLVQYGSRVTYRLLLAGAPAQVQAYQQWLQKRIETLESGRPEMRTLDRANNSCRWSACSRPCWWCVASCCVIWMPAPCCAVSA